MKTLIERSIASFIRFVLDAAWWLVVAAPALLTGLLVFSFCVNLERNNLAMNPGARAGDFQLVRER